MVAVITSVTAPRKPIQCHLSLSLASRWCFFPPSVHAVWGVASIHNQSYCPLFLSVFPVLTSVPCDRFRGEPQLLIRFRSLSFLMPLVTAIQLKWHIIHLYHHSLIYTKLLSLSQFPVGRVQSEPQHGQAPPDRQRACSRLPSGRRGNEGGKRRSLCEVLPNQVGFCLSLIGV